MEALTRVWEEKDLCVLIGEMSEEVTKKGLTPLAIVQIQRIYKLAGLESSTTWISAIDALIREETG